MPRRSAGCPAAYREQIIAFARAGCASKEMAKWFERSEQTIRNWTFRAEADRGERFCVFTTDERTELSRLRRENLQLKVERDISGRSRSLIRTGFADETPDSSAS